MLNLWGVVCACVCVSVCDKVNVISYGNTMYSVDGGSQQIGIVQLSSASLVIPINHLRCCFHRFGSRCDWRLNWCLYDWLWCINDWWLLNCCWSYNIIRKRTVKHKIHLIVKPTNNKVAIINIYLGLVYQNLAIGPVAPVAVGVEHFAVHGIRPPSIAPNGIVAVR